MNDEQSVGNFCLIIAHFNRKRNGKSSEKIVPLQKLAAKHRTDCLLA
jgi:hypothetical protein